MSNIRAKAQPTTTGIRRPKQFEEPETAADKRLQVLQDRLHGLEVERRLIVINIRGVRDLPSAVLRLPALSRADISAKPDVSAAVLQEAEVEERRKVERGGHLHPSEHREGGLRRARVSQSDREL